MSHAFVTIIASGYFDCLHVGHLAYLKAAKKLGHWLVVVVNNDGQATLKKGRPFMSLAERLEIVRALRVTDQAVAAIDSDRSVCQTLRKLHEDMPNGRLVFANGGDVNSEADCREASVCRELGIEMAFGVGGDTKIQSSSWLLAGDRDARMDKLAGV